MNKTSEDELVEKVALAMTGLTDDVLEEDDYEAAERAIAAARPLIAQQAKVEVLLELMTHHGVPISELHSYATEHGITLEDK